MSKLVIAVAAGMLTALAAGAEVFITPEVRIVAADTPPVVRQAAQELRRWLFGGKSVDGEGGVEIRLQYREDGDPEAWEISADGAAGTVTIAGGQRGILYGVYEFLERFAGVRFLDEKVTVAPSSERIAVPEGKITGAPYFRIRQIYDNLDWYADSIAFKVRNKGLTYAPPELGGYFRIGSPRQHHTYYNYSSGWDPERDAECFSMNEAGVRLVATDNVGPGQICMTAPAARAKVLAQLRQYIADDRQGEMPYPVIYDLSPNDNDVKCVCPGCRALAAQYGGNYAAPLLDFTNFIAREIRRDHPEILIRTFAYLYALQPVPELELEPNVIIHLAPMGLEFAQERDTLKPLTAPENAATAALLRRWSEQAATLAIWDYWVLFATDVQAPYVNDAMLQPNMRFYRDVKARDVFSECEFPEQQSFFGLKRYLGYKLLDNPDADADALRREFFAGMYGPATEPMRAWYDYLQLRQTRDGKIDFACYGIGLWGYLDGAFFRNAEALLRRARQAAEPGSLAQAAVEREFIPVYAALLQHLALGMKRDGWDAERVFADYEAFSRAALAYYYPASAENFRDELEQRLRRLGGMARNPVDPEAAVIELGTPYMQFFSPALRVEAMPEAFHGEAAVFGTPENSAGFHEKELTLGIFSVAEFKERIEPVKWDREALPADGLFHWYELGEVELGRFDYLYIHDSRLLQLWLRDFYRPGEDNRVRISVSMKLEGAAYVPGSTAADAIAVDRVRLERVR